MNQVETRPNLSTQLEAVAQDPAWQELDSYTQLRLESSLSIVNRLGTDGLVAEARRINAAAEGAAGNHPARYAKKQREYFIDLHDRRKLGDDMPLRRLVVQGVMRGLAYNETNGRYVSDGMREYDQLDDPKFPALVRLADIALQASAA